MRWPGQPAGTGAGAGPWHTVLHPERRRSAHLERSVSGTCWLHLEHSPADPCGAQLCRCICSTAEHEEQSCADACGALLRQRMWSCKSIKDKRTLAGSAPGTGHRARCSCSQAEGKEYQHCGLGCLQQGLAQRRQRPWSRAHTSCSGSPLRATVHSKAFELSPHAMSLPPCLLPLTPFCRFSPDQRSHLLAGLDPRHHRLIPVRACESSQVADDRRRKLHLRAHTVRLHVLIGSDKDQHSTSTLTRHQYKIYNMLRTPPLPPQV